jgi:hypothetical protein
LEEDLQTAEVLQILGSMSLNQDENENLCKSDLISIQGMEIQDYHTVESV